MKIWNYLVGGAIGLVLLTSGCHRRETIDTTALENEFKEVDAGLKEKADKAVSTIKSGDFQNALVHLQALANEAKLSPGQRQIVQDTMAHVQKALGEAASKAGSELNKAGSELQK